MVSEDGIWHYTAIKSLSRLLSSKNSDTKRKQHFSMNCLQGFTQESTRDQHLMSSMAWVKRCYSEKLKKSQ